MEKALSRAREPVLGPAELLAKWLTQEDPSPQALILGFGSCKVNGVACIFKVLCVCLGVCSLSEVSRPVLSRTPKSLSPKISLNYFTVQARDTKLPGFILSKWHSGGRDKKITSSRLASTIQQDPTSKQE